MIQIMKDYKNSAKIENEKERATFRTTSAMMVKIVSLCLFCFIILACTHQMLWEEKEVHRVCPVQTLLFLIRSPEEEIREGHERAQGR